MRATGIACAQMRHGRGSCHFLQGGALLRLFDDLDLPWYYAAVLPVSHHAQSARQKVPRQRCVGHPCHEYRTGAAQRMRVRRASHGSMRAAARLPRGRSLGERGVLASLGGRGVGRVGRGGLGQVGGWGGVSGVCVCVWGGGGGGAFGEIEVVIF